MAFVDREEAGRLLAEKLTAYSNRNNLLVLAIPRGGVVVGDQISRKLRVPLDVLITKKIGAPYNSELAIGAIAEDGEPIIDQAISSQLNVTTSFLGEEVRSVRARIRSYIHLFRKGKALDVSGKEVIVTDDGIATGYTMEAALTWLVGQRCKHIAVAVPIVAIDAYHRLQSVAHAFFSLEISSSFGAVGQFYQHFDQVEDGVVVNLLERQRHINLT